MSRWLLGTLIAGMLILVLGGSGAILPLKARLLGSRSRDTELSEAKSELAVLKAELARYKSAKEGISGDPSRFIPAFIYSTYPFNDKHLLTISAGADDGVRAGMAVLSGDRVLIGRVQDVFSWASTVQTIFDPDFELPVRIGDEGYNALLKGGAIPGLALIPKKALVKEGDVVYSAGASFPYGLPLGTVGEVQDLDYEAFRKAPLELPYNLNEIKILLVAEKIGK